MTKEENTTMIGLITIRTQQKKEKSVFVSQPKQEQVSAKETIQITETTLTEDYALVEEAVPGYLTLAGKPEIPEQQEAINQPDTINQADSECTPEILPQIEIASEKKTKEAPDSIPQTKISLEPDPQQDSLHESKQAEAEVPAEPQEPELPGAAEPETEPLPLNQLQLTVSRFDITSRAVPAEELPESLDELADYSNAYEAFTKIGVPEMLHYCSNSYFFRQYMIEMYSRARREGDVTCYKYMGKIFLDFPIENQINKVRLYASFIPNTKSGKKWFCWGIRKGGKIHDLAYLGTVYNDNLHLQALCNLEEAGINSRYELRTYLEDCFNRAIAEQQIYTYTIGDQTIIEYPIYLNTRKDGNLITATYRVSPETKKWHFIKFRFREIKHPLDISIQKDESKGWRKAERKKQKAEEKKQEAVQKEAEWKQKEAEKQLIPFYPFPIRKTAAAGNTEHYGNLKKFAYIHKEPALLDLEKQINLCDTDRNMEAIEKAFSRCNPYTDITYYIWNGKQTAELRVPELDQNEIPIYAVFTRNKNQSKQPWYLESLFYGSMFSRTIPAGSYHRILKEVQEKGIDTITSAGELAELIERRFNEAIEKNEIYVYGTHLLQYAELPLGLLTPEGRALYLQLVPGKKPNTWQFRTVKLRSGDDPRFAISDEYKEEQERRRTSPLPCVDAVEETNVKDAAAGTSELRETTQKTHVTGTFGMFPGVDGKPISLMDFCKEITDKKLRPLAEMAEEEKWGFTENEPFGILYRYLNAQFIRLGYENKIGISEGTTEQNAYVVMHTGLYTKGLHEPIYAGFKPVPYFSEGYTGPMWKLDGFCCEREGGPVSDQIHQRFSTLPDTVDFLKKDGEYIPLPHYCLDLKVPIVLKEEHILKERGYRLPEQFLRDTFNYKKDIRAADYLDRLIQLETEEEQKEFWLSEFSVYLEGAEDTYDELLQRLQYVVEEAQACSIRHPITAYYPRDNSITWLLPLRFPKEGDIKNLALVVGRRGGGGYKGITLMPVEAVYHRARVVANPDGSWVKTDILEQYSVDWQTMEEKEFEEDWNWGGGWSETDGYDEEDDEGVLL